MSITTLGYTELKISHSKVIWHTLDAKYYLYPNIFIQRCTQIEVTV